MQETNVREHKLYTLIAIIKCFHSDGVTIRIFSHLALDFVLT